MVALEPLVYQETQVARENPASDVQESRETMETLVPLEDQVSLVLKELRVSQVLPLRY